MAVYPAASFIAANSEYLYHPAHSAFTLGQIDWTVIAWAYGGGRTQTIIGKGYGYWWMSRKLSGDVGIAVYTPTEYGAWLPWPGSGWHLFVARYIAATRSLGISCDGGTWVSITVPADLVDDLYPLAIGRRQTTADRYWNGRIGPCGIAKGYVLTADDIAELYNGGKGRVWSQLSSGLKRKFGSAWWDMTEESDGSGAVTRASWDGNLNLTDNNTVASADGPIVVPDRIQRVMSGGMADLTGGLGG